MSTKKVRRKWPLSEKLLFLLGTAVVLAIVSFIAFAVYRFTIQSIYYPEMSAMISYHDPEHEFSRSGAFVVEIDDYGRILFREESSNEQEPDFYMIMQRQAVNDKTTTYYFGDKASEDELVYYYPEDYILLVDSIFDLTEEDKHQIEILKQKNDWNQPLREDKMFGIPIDKRKHKAWARNAEY